MVIEAVIPGKFLARTARLAVARGLSLTGNPALNLTLSLDAHDRDGP
jgi:hypothetical protein